MSTRPVAMRQLGSKSERNEVNLTQREVDTMKGRTPKKDIKAENKARTRLIPLGYRHNGSWRFEKDGQEHDLSAMDIELWLKKQAN